MAAVFSVLAVIFIIYGVIVRFAGSGTAFFLVWIFLGLLCAAAAFYFGKELWRHVPHGLRLAVRITAAAVMIWILVTEALILTGFRKPKSVRADYLIVLGAQVYADGPCRVLQYRLDEAAAYLSGHPETACIVSGGQGWNEPRTEAEVMKEYLVKKGIEKDRILMEDASTNTVENIRFSMKMLPSPDVPAGIVTNNFHAFRAMRIARKQGLSLAYGMPAASEPFYQMNNMFREFFGVMKDLLRGNM